MTSFFINFTSDTTAPAPWFNTRAQPTTAPSTFTSIVDQKSIEAPVALKFSSAWSGSGSNGMQGGIYPDSVMKGYYYFSSGTHPIEVSGLDPKKVYKFQFFASRDGAGDRTTIYSIGNQSDRINASLNKSDLAEISNVKADAQGKVVIRVSKDPAADYGYINAMVIDVLVDQSQAWSPQISAIKDQSVSAGNVLEFPVNAYDGNGNSGLTLTASGLPSYGSFTHSGNGTGKFRFSPTNANAGDSKTITVTAKDPSGRTVTESFTLKVNAVNLPPDPAPSGGIQVARPLGTTGAGYGYYEYLPGNYTKTPNASFPLVLFLHGAGEKGNGTSGLSLILRHGPPKMIKNGKHFNAIVISPQSPDWWNKSNLNSFLQWIKANYRVDSRRIYVTGISMGGGGTWELSKSFTSQLAAIVPICGAAGATGAANLKGLPVWAFHSVGDGVVGVGNTYSHMKGITGIDPAPGYSKTGKTETATWTGSNWSWAAGDVITGSQKEVIMTIYPDSSHDSWTRTYDNPKLWDWLFQQAQ